MSGQVRRFETPGGHLIYRIPLLLFPEFWGYVYLIKSGDLLILVDAGSGFGQSNEHLEIGFKSIRAHFQERFDWADLTHVLISHGHVDHFGGLHYLRERTSASIGIHELDAAILEGYEQSIDLAAERTKAFLNETGLTTGQQEQLLGLYLLNKGLFRSIHVDFTYESIGMKLGPLAFHHAPGHSPGQVVIHLENALFTGDHLLPDISPHMAPERLAPNTGLFNYLESLNCLLDLNGSRMVGLPGHGEPIDDLKQRTIEIILHHYERLSRLFHLVQNQGRTIAELSQELFPGAQGFHELFALEETAAHIEFLVKLGQLEVEALKPMTAGNFAPVYRSAGYEKMLIRWFEPYLGRE
jgi:glyoxylase-like metal-dependent hydrolase (beta-lactamase superfamily II)